MIKLTAREVLEKTIQAIELYEKSYVAEYDAAGEWKGGHHRKSRYQAAREAVPECWEMATFVAHNMYWGNDVAFMLKCFTEETNEERYHGIKL